MAKDGISQITTSQTFQTWLDRTNEIVTILGSDAMTASTLGDTTEGNATLVGSFTANTVIAFDGLNTDVISPKDGSTSIGVTAPLNITTSLQVAQTLTSSVGPRLNLSSGSVTWRTGFENNADNNFIIDSGVGTVKLRLTPTGNLSVAGTVTSGSGGFIGALTGNVTGNVTGTVSSLSNHTTSNLTEGTNLYFTTARARSSLSAGTGVTYNSSTGQISIGQDVAVSNSVNFRQVNAIRQVAIDLPSAGTAWLSQLNMISTTGTISGSQAANIADFSIDGRLFLRSILGYNPATTSPTEPYSSTPTVQQTNAYGLFAVNDSPIAPTKAELWVTSADTTKGNIFASGNITAFYDFSDIRKKENIERITGALDKVLKVGGYTYNFKNDERKITGVIAQEIEEVLPEVVYEVVDSETGEATKAVHYGNIVGLLIEAIKDLKKEVDDLKNAD